MNIRRAIERADRAGSYAEAIRILTAAGIRLYHVDVRTHTIVYNSDLESHIAVGPSLLEATAVPAPALNAYGIEAAMSAIDRGQVDYAGFLALLWSAGVIDYDVNFMWRQITFCGADGRTHVRSIAENALQKELVRA